MEQHKRYVLTGSPGSGKTTLLQALQSEHITCFEEVFRVLFLQAKDRGVDSPFQDEPIALSEEIIKGRVADFNSATVSKIHLFDRGIHDVIAYLDEIQIEVPKKFIEIGQSHIYDKVFLLMTMSGLKILIKPKRFTTNSSGPILSMACRQLLCPSFRWKNACLFSMTIYEQRTGTFTKTLGLVRL